MVEPGEVSTPVIEAILARRSVRTGFVDRPLGAGHLDAILRCGLAAPSSKNAQPWRFHVVSDAALRRYLADAASEAGGLDAYVPHDPTTGQPDPRWVSTVRESARVLREAPTLIVIENRGVFSGGRRTLAAAEPEALAGSLAGYGFEMIGLGAAIENMWLAANSLGVAAAFLGDLNIIEHLIADALALKGDLVGTLALGYGELDSSPRTAPPASTQVPDPVVYHQSVSVLTDRTGGDPPRTGVRTR